MSNDSRSVLELADQILLFRHWKQRGGKVVQEESYLIEGGIRICTVRLQMPDGNLPAIKFYVSNSEVHIGRPHNFPDSSISSPNGGQKNARR